MRKIYGGLLLLLFIYFSSCNSDSQIADRILHSVENIAEQYPDSALALMDSIENPYLLNQGLQAKYWTLLVESKYKVGTDISYDTLIFNAKAYFKKTHNIKYLALSTFYSGRVLESLQKPQEAMSAFIEAESIATAAKDTSLTGFIRYNIGDTYYKKGLYDEAIVKFKQSAGNFANRQNDYKKEIMALDYIGANFVMKNNIDSALFYFNSALSKANNSNDSTEMTNILLNMGAAFLKLKKIDEAKIKLIEAKKYNIDSIQQAKIDLNLARVYANTRPDSAIFYISNSLKLAQKNDDKALLANVYFYFAQLEEKSGNYNTSLEHYKKYANCVFSVYDEKQKVNVLEVQKKYDFELLKNANEKLTIERLWIYIISILVIGAISFIFYRNRARSKEALLIAEQQIYQLKEMVNKKSETANVSSDNSNEEINNKLRNILFQQLDIFKDISIMEAQLQKEEKKNGEKILEKVNTILYNSTKSFDWKIFYKSVNVSYNNYLIQLKKKFPRLNDEDILICCLLKSGFYNKEIALLTGSNQNKIQKKKTAIKEKMGIKEHGNFIDLLDEMIKKSDNSMKIENHS